MEKKNYGKEEIQSVELIRGIASTIYSFVLKDYAKQEVLNIETYKFVCRQIDNAVLRLMLLKQKLRDDQVSKADAEGIVYKD